MPFRGKYVKNLAAILNWRRTVRDPPLRSGGNAITAREVWSSGGNIMDGRRKGVRGKDEEG